MRQNSRRRIVVVGSAPAAVYTVTVSFSASNILDNATTQANATLKDNDNNILSNRVVVWSATNPSIASIDSSTGFITAHSAGTAEFTAQCEGKSGSNSITVSISSNIYAGSTSESIAIVASTTTNATFNTSASASLGTTTTASANINGATGEPNIASLPTLASLVDVQPDHSINAAIRALVAGETYVDPITGVTVIKLTDATWPVSNSGCVCPYSEGGPFISRKISGSHIVGVLNPSNQEVYYINATRSGGNSGRVSYNGIKYGASAFAFSYDVGTPSYVYYVDGTRLYVFDATSPGSNLNLPYIPTAGKDFTSDMGGISPYLQWLSSTANDDRLVFQNIWQNPGDLTDRGLVFAYKPSDGTLKKQAYNDLNQPQVSRVGDGWVTLCSNVNNTTAMWNYNTDAFDVRSPLYTGHPAPLKTGFAEFDGSDIIVYAADTNTKTVLGGGGITFTNAWKELHKASQWINGTTLNDSWFIDTSEAQPFDGALLSWSMHSGDIFKTTHSIGYGFTTFSQVVQGPSGTAGRPAELTTTLTKKGSIGALVEGSWYDDSATQTMYVWAVGGANPSNTVALYGGQGSSTAISWHKTDVSDARRAVYVRNYPHDYYSESFGTLSPDGLAIMFSSNMGLPTGRNDVYLVIMPET